MKQTAVEWLVEQILTEVQDYEDGDIETESEPFKHEYVNKYIGMVDLSEFVIKAKEMEKEQIVKAYESLEHRHGENYYNETFNKSINNKG
jgi:hypothetical protein